MHTRSYTHTHTHTYSLTPSDTPDKETTQTAPTSGRGVGRPAGHGDLRQSSVKDIAGKRGKSGSATASGASATTRGKGKTTSEDTGRLLMYTHTPLYTHTHTHTHTSGILLVPSNTRDDKSIELNVGPGVICSRSGGGEGHGAIVKGVTHSSLR